MSGFGVIALQYLPFLARALSSNLKKNLDYNVPQICVVAKESKTFQILVIFLPEK